MVSIFRERLPGGDRRGGRARRAVLGAVAGLLLAPTAAAAQESGDAGPDLAATLAERQQALPEGRAAYEETLLTAPPGGAASERDLRLAAKIAVFQEAPRERLEIRPVSGNAFGEPIVLVSDGKSYFLVTKVGATPLAESARASDPLVLQVLASSPAETARKRTVEGPGGELLAVVYRQPRSADFSSETAFDLKPARLGGGLLKKGLASFGESEDATVTASAGARGVGEVETPEGMVSVTPDSAGVAWLEARDVGPLALEAFLLEGELGPYAAAEAP